MFTQELKRMGDLLHIFSCQTARGPRFSLLIVLARETGDKHGSN